MGGRTEAPSPKFLHSPSAGGVGGRRFTNSGGREGGSGSALAEASASRAW